MAVADTKWSAVLRYFLDSKISRERTGFIKGQDPEEIIMITVSASRININLNTFKYKQAMHH